MSEDIRLYNQDCMDWFADNRDERVDCIITDPPYGIDFRSQKRNQSHHNNGKFSHILNDRQPQVFWLHYAARMLKLGGVCLIFCRWDKVYDFHRMIEMSGLIPKGEIIWDKKRPGMGDLEGGIGLCHENIIMAVQYKFKWPNKRPLSVVRIGPEYSCNYKHPTAKPVGLMEWFVTNFTKPGQTILDPFMGGGPVAVAAKKHDRKYIGIEIEKEYYEIAKDRVGIQENGDVKKFCERGGLASPVAKIQ